MDDTRYSGRLKSINLTKLQESYKRYSRVVPKELRARELSDSWHPSTPDYKVNLSHSLWNKRLSTWRKLVHKWDCIKDSDCETLSEYLKSGDLEKFISTCEKSRDQPIDVNVCDHLLNEHTSELFYPVIYKPAWFNGSLSHNGFQTVDEIDFLKSSKDLLSDLDDDFNSKFVSSYSSNYSLSE